MSGNLQPGTADYLQPSTPDKKLKEWVAIQHGGQHIRRTKEPYLNHLLAVAEMAATAVPFGYAIGLCHDLLEDTATDSGQLLQALISFGYTAADAAFITDTVVELTDVFTTEAYPDLGKKERKALEALRLPTISPAAQTVKYGDLIYNIAWVIKYDKKDAPRYLKKKRLLLMKMTQGDPELRHKALQVIHQHLRK
jgi:(p)ppGpp synthase/HD superfamily hydrolase